jgi:hypothetical protein
MPRILAGICEPVHKWAQKIDNPFGGENMLRECLADSQVPPIRLGTGSTRTTDTIAAAGPREVTSREVLEW